MSYGNNLTTFTFSKPGSTLIVGENLDQTSNGKTSNGTGKTTCLNALVYGVYDEPLSDISKDNLINNINNKNMEVNTYLSIDDDKIHIKRERKGKHGNGVWLYVNGVDVSLSSVALTNAKIVELIGIPYELFIQIVVFSATTDPFLKLKKAEQTDMFERLVGLTTITEKANQLKSWIKDNTADLKTITATIEVREAEKNRHIEQLEHSKNRVQSWQEQKDKNIAILEDAATLLAEPNYEAEQESHETLTKLNNNIILKERELAEITAKIEEGDHAARDLDILNEIDFEYEQSAHEEILRLQPQLVEYNSALDQLIQDKQQAERLQLELDNIGRINFDAEEIAHQRYADANLKYKQEFANHQEIIKRGDGYTNDKLKVDSELAQLANHICPFCEQHFADTALKTEKLTKDLSELVRNLDVVSNETEVSARLLDQYEIELQEAKAILTTSSLKELLKLKNDFNIITTKLSSLNLIDDAPTRRTIDELNIRIKSLTDATTTNSLQDLLQLKYKRETLLDKMETFSNVHTDFEEVTEELAALRSKRLDIKSTLTTNSIVDLMKIKADNDKIRSDLKSFKGSSNPHLESYEELLNITLEPIQYNDANELEDMIRHQQLLLKLLTKRDSFVRKNLLNKYIPYLNSRLQYYLHGMGLPHKVEFTHEMTAVISRFGRNLDYGQLSNGQQARVNLSLSLAFSDVLQKLHAQVNVCMFDEILDEGLDTVGIQLAIKILKERVANDQVAMYIISHKNEVDNVFDNILTIQMHKEFSNIKTNEEDA
jgi:DNA repair exonuclease SbcCD ATPase subunit